MKKKKHHSLFLVTLLEPCIENLTNFLKISVEFWLLKISKKNSFLSKKKKYFFSFWLYIASTKKAACGKTSFEL